MQIILVSSYKYYARQRGAFELKPKEIHMSVTKTNMGVARTLPNFSYKHERQLSAYELKYEL
jgi:hypothetical protein